MRPTPMLFNNSPTIELNKDLFLIQLIHIFSFTEFPPLKSILLCIK
jgi:hypothetical protein